MLDGPTARGRTLSSYPAVWWWSILGCSGAAGMVGAEGSCSEGVWSLWQCSGPCSSSAIRPGQREGRLLWPFLLILLQCSAGSVAEEPRWHESEGSLAEQNIQNNYSFICWWCSVSLCLISCLLSAGSGDIMKRIWSCLQAKDAETKVTASH